MSDTLTLLRSIDALYEGVVTDPSSWGGPAFGDWAEEVAGAVPTRSQARAIRRCLRAAERLRDFWAGDRAQVAADDWRTRVDVALGARAWRPTLELAMEGLTEQPGEELFLEVKRRFRIVNSQPWMDGVDFETWRASASSS